MPDLPDCQIIMTPVTKKEGLIVRTQSDNDKIFVYFISSMDLLHKLHKCPKTQSAIAYEYKKLRDLAPTLLEKIKKS